jgi:hypothetical protein
MVEHPAWWQREDVSKKPDRMSDTAGLCGISTLMVNFQSKQPRLPAVLSENYIRPGFAS